MSLDTNRTDDKILTTIQQEYKILAEYKMVESEKIGGMYVIPSFGNSLLWYGVIFVRHGFYTDGVFRFNILLPDKFPDEKAVPTIIFQGEIFHPLICPFTGTLDLLQAFPYWRCGEDHIWQLLKYIQSIFIDPFECIRVNAQASNKWQNKEAVELLMQNRAGYIQRAKECVGRSKDHVYDSPPTDDPHYIAFEEYNAEVHGQLKERIRDGKEPATSANTSQTKGLSWVKEGEYTPLSLE